MSLESAFPEEAELCRLCNHLQEVHDFGSTTCSVEDCDCFGFAFPFTRADVRKMKATWATHGWDINKLADALHVSVADLE